MKVRDVLNNLVAIREPISEIYNDLLILGVIKQLLDGMHDKNFAEELNKIFEEKCKSYYDREVGK